MCIRDSIQRGGDYLHRAFFHRAAGMAVSEAVSYTHLSDRLKAVNPQLYSRVRCVLDVNKAQRHIRGGIATREKYRHQSEDGEEPREDS